MNAIFVLTVRRLREPAILILFLFGGILAFFVSGSDRFELLSSAEDINALGSLSRNHVLFGTVVLCGLAVLITVFTAASEIPRDINSRMVSILLSKPVGRHEYVFGKFLGALALGIANGAAWITIMIVTRMIFGDDGSYQLDLGAWILQQYMCLLILVPVAALAICFSCCFSDVVSMIVTAGYILLCFGMTVAPIMSTLSDSHLTSSFILYFYFFFPNLPYFLHSQDGLIGNLALLTYACTTGTLFLIIGARKFNCGDVYG